MRSTGLFSCTALAIAALLVFFAPSVQAAEAPACSPNTGVSMPDGKVCGVVGDGVVNYFGIPYAEPPVGALRWKVPVPVKPWRQELQATKPAMTCAAPGGPSVAGSEDCLYLNVQVPAGTKPGDQLPVMVEIHGGGFLVTAFGSLPDTTAMGKHVIAVAIEYRTGIMGFLAAKALGPNSGNYGIEDQQAALRWVQKNIKSFGGNPGNVTIFGTSAGGASVCINAISPGSKGLFHRGISRSGFYNASARQDSVWQLADCKSQLLSESEAEASGARFIEKVGCTDAKDVAACLREAPIAKLVGASLGSKTPGTTGTLAPIVNGTTIPMSPGKAFRTGQVNDVSLIIGVNRDEIQPRLASNTAEGYRAFLNEKYGQLASRIEQLYPLKRFPEPAAFLAFRTVVADADSVCPALTAFGHLSKHIPVYAYQNDDSAAPVTYLDGQLPWGSYHGANSAIIEVPMDRNIKPTANLAVLINQIRTAWLGYARSGNPTADGAPFWPAYSANEPLVMSLRQGGDSVLMPADVLAKQHHCAFWDAVTPEPTF